MRFVRSLAAIGALVGATAAFAPRAADAQAVRDFENSWFWGVKGGVLYFWTSEVSHKPAPFGGFDMLITRERVALNLSYDQAFFDDFAAFPEYDAAGQPLGSNGRLRIENMRRVTAQLQGFPKRFGILRPYVGAGFALNQIQRTEVLDADPTADTQAAVDDVRTRVAAIFSAGAQAQLSRFAVFGQASVMPARSRFVFTGAETLFFEGGIRWNIGSSRDRGP